MLHSRNPPNPETQSSPYLVVQIQMKILLSFESFRRNWYSGEVVFSVETLIQVSFAKEPYKRDYILETLIHTFPRLMGWLVYIYVNIYIYRCICLCHELYLYIYVNMYIYRCICLCHELYHLKITNSVWKSWTHDRPSRDINRGHRH